MSDLTIIMCTPNRVPERWAEYHRERLIESARGAPIIAISAKPLSWPDLNLIQTDYGLLNLYRQVLRGAKAATTEWIAMADDDTLYPSEHFAYRPPEPGFWYNLNRWHIFTWGDPFYFYKPLPGGGLMIATREMVVRALEARFRLPEPLPHSLLHELGVREEARQYDGGAWRGWASEDPVVSFYHEASVDRACQNHTKRVWPLQTTRLPVWGKAASLRERFR